MTRSLLQKSGSAEGGSIAARLDDYCLDCLIQVQCYLASESGRARKVTVSEAVRHALIYTAEHQCRGPDQE